MNDDTRDHKAKEFEVDLWVDEQGQSTEPIQLKNLDGKFKVLFCFQSWCPGCHSKGFPDLKKMVSALGQKEDIYFMAVQTVFEGFESNTYEKMVKTQQDYQLNIPFGHDAGNGNVKGSNIMRNYRTGGTPWFIFIDKQDKVVFSDFHLNVDAAIEFLKTNSEDES